MICLLVPVLLSNGMSSSSYQVQWEGLQPPGKAGGQSVSTYVLSILSAKFPGIPKTPWVPGNEEIPGITAAVLRT